MADLVGTTDKLGLELPADGSRGWGEVLRQNIGKVEEKLAKSHAGSPVGAVTPDFAGQFLYDESNQVPYISTGLTDTDWVSVYTGPATPTGVIVFWSGDTTDIPSGWALCDGDNGTPDLRDRMIVGAGNDYSAHSQGGSDTQTTESSGSHSHTASTSTSSAGSHSHTASTSVSVSSRSLDSNTQMPSHRHLDGYQSYTNDPPGFGTGGGYGSYRVGTGSSNLGGNPWSSTVGGNGSHNHGASGSTDVDSNGSHSHSASTSVDSAGSHTHSVDVRSRYYALALIMKT